MQRLLLVDFDGTLFDSDLFHKDISLYLLNTYKTPIEDFHSTFEKAKLDGPHSLRKQFKLLGLKNISGLINEIKEYIGPQSNKYIYEETIDFINSYKKEIVIYTYADSNYFKFKLAVTGLNKLRLPVIAVNSDKNEFLLNNMNTAVKIKKRNQDFTNPDRIIWIDDKVSGFKNLINGVEFVRIKRTGSKHSVHATPKGTKEIKSLLEVI